MFHFSEEEQDGKEYTRYARRIAKGEWRRQVEELGFALVKEVPFEVARFKCLAFAKRRPAGGGRA
jgi:hypothetical protein